MTTSSDNIPCRYAERMAKKKSARERMMRGKRSSQGLLVVHTGAGKGKSSAAFGMVLRCIGHGLKTGVVQFIKGAWDTGEHRVLAGFPGLVTFLAMGEGFTWETQNRDRDVAAARRAWEMAESMLADPTYRMVVLDELNVVLRYQYLKLEEVIAAILARPGGQHAVVTGRNAPEGLVEVADLVTEMTLIKHPFRRGIKAQSGVEF
ncbi:Cob(I)alamin adenosyltransferase [invertebrate metagenome]|uniref:Cob(I)alamin adenosyltransferase n=1 Tax=invertebrate metagenome TaxID=1711999 RepID=A0A484H8I9_9ZZZZ